MDDYISREKVLETIRYRVCQGQGNKEHICQRGSCAYCGIMEIMSDISSIEAADVQPVKYGKWEMNSDYPDRLICNQCNSTYDVYFCKRDSMHYCPNCGSKNRMDGESE